LIFRPEFAQLIVNRRKTQARLPAKRGVVCRFEEGKDYAVQPGRGEKQIERVLILSVVKATLGAIDHQAALAEGFRSVEDFRDDWRAIHRIPDGTPTPWALPVWVLTFELYRPEPKVKPDRDVVRLLANQQGRKDAGQYTSSRHAAIPDEPEAIDPGVIEHLPSTMEARQRWVRDRAYTDAAYRDLPLAERIMRLQALAAAKRVDITKQEASILRRLESIESKLRRAA
jgi:hypothetical protein